MIEQTIINAMRKIGLDPEALREEMPKYLNGLTYRLSCIWKEVSESRRATEAQYGKPPIGTWNPQSAQFDLDPRYEPRSLVVAPKFYEPIDPNQGLYTLLLKLKLEDDLGRCPSAGFYANIGTDEFKVVLMAADGSMSEMHTLTPNTSMPIDNFMRELHIYQKANTTARYQVKVN